MNSKKRSPIEFTSKMSTVQTVITFVWILIHALVIPMIITNIPALRGMGEDKLNIIWYSVSAAALVIINFTFLRRDFDILLDNPVKVLIEVLYAFVIIMAFDLILSGLLSLYISFSGTELVVENQNNEVIMNQAKTGLGYVKASAVFLAPICEELLFRAGVFGSLRKVNRILAYVVSILLFSVYHVWAYAINDPQYWVYILQYLPVSFILCRCYERSNTIWGSMLFHMMWNGITLNVLSTMM